MPKYFQDNELETLDPIIRERILQMQGAVDESDRIKTELEGGFKKIYSKPSAKKKLAEAIKEAGIENFQVPEQPWEAELEASRRETADLTQKFEKTSAEQELRTKASELGVPWSEMPKVAEFQKEFHILDNIKALELYAERRQPELPQANTFNFNKMKDGIPTEDEARENTFKEIRMFKTGR